MQSKDPESSIHGTLEENEIKEILGLPVWVMKAQSMDQVLDMIHTYYS